MLLNPTTSPALHAGTGAPSDWLLRWAHLLPANGTVLDLACGRGRHLRWLSARGWRCTGIDRDAAALAEAHAAADAIGPAGAPELIVADLEQGDWPLGDRRFDAVLVTNYLWRPLFPRLLAALAPGGVLLYETFALGQQTVGRPSRAEFLLAPGELLALCAGLRIVAYEDGVADGPLRFVQRVVAVHDLARDDPPPRHALRPSAA